MNSMLPLLLSGDGANSELLMMMAMSGGAGDMNSMLPLLLSGEGDGKLSKLLPLMMMGGNMGGDMASNPLMMMSLLGDGEISEDLLMMMMGQGGSVDQFGQQQMNPMLMYYLMKEDAPAEEEPAADAGASTPPGN